MSFVQSLSSIFGVNKCKLSREENILLEAELFLRVVGELKIFFREMHDNYFKLQKLTKEMEVEMLDANFALLLLKDILLSQEYTVEGIAHCTHFPEEIFYEILEGRNVMPSAMLLQRLIELHREVNPKLYQYVVRKILSGGVLVA